jgi:fucose permease
MATCALLLTNAGPNVPLLALIVFVMMGFNNALVTQTIGPMCAESVSPSLMATASGLVIAIGEFFGGGVAPIISGQLADRFGIAHVLWLPFGAACAGFVLCLFLRETLVRKRGGVMRAVSEI